ncbi:caspase family protein [Candidatus Poribacteria bacterium]|nr:caspase family protein [Candidatus Poribacteria bacterium]
MSIARLFFSVFFVLLLSSQSLLADKWALLIGVNEYIYDGIPDLKGCETDVELMRKVLTTKYGFPKENIGLILSEKATKENIVAALKEWLIEKPKAGDIVILYYSGHGVQIVDTSGDEEDGFDEAFCPTDVKPNESKTEFLNVLLDDELDELLSQIPTDNVTVILDCCHSGTATKSLMSVGMSQSRVIDRDLLLVAKQKPKPPKNEKPPQGSSRAPGNPSHVVITGCDDHEVSQERTWYSPDVGYFRSGVLTKYLVDELNQQQPDITYTNLMARIRQKIGTGAVQTPQLYGDIERPIFSTRQPAGDIETVSAATKPYVVITDTIGGQLTINAGSIHGVTKGSIYAVYSPEDMEFSGRELGQIQISKVALDTSTATRIERPLVVEGLIVPTCRAVEIEHAFPKDNLYLWVDANPEQRNTFSQHLGVGNVVITSEEQRADFILRLSSEFGGITGRLISTEGRIVSEVSEKSVEKLADKLRRTLEREVLIKLFRLFRNPNPPFNLRVWVNRRDNPTYKIGETLSMSFRAEKDCYLILLNVDSEGYVTMMFPNKYRPDNQIIGGQTYTIPSSAMPFKIRTKPPHGRELVMALATTTQLSNPIFQIGDQSEILADLTGAKLGSQLIRIVSESLQEGNITDSSVSLPTNKWVTDSLIVVLSP